MRSMSRAEITRSESRSSTNPEVFLELTELPGLALLLPAFEEFAEPIDVALIGIARQEDQPEAGNQAVEQRGHRSRCSKVPKFSEHLVELRPGGAAELGGEERL